jgi:selenocysteine lyase/cysteine desulfurase
MALLRENVYGNPHSSNPTSLAMTHLVERTHDCVFEFFNPSPDEYAAIFTPNASGTLKLVGESYPLGASDHYLLTFDNHKPVNGIREFARARGVQTNYVPSSSSFYPGVQRLYERLGYEVVGQLRDYIIAGHSEVLLRKTIGPLARFGLSPDRPAKGGACIQGR